MNIPQLPADKANHALWGAAIFIVALAITRHPWAAIIAVAGCAAAKELSDAVLNWRATGEPMQGPHGVEFLDFAATCFGGILALLPLAIAELPQ